MLRTLRGRLSYANVTATLALFLALAGGSAYAMNEWTGSNIRDETLTGADVKGKAATSTTAAVNGSLTGADIAGQPANPALGQPFVEGSLTGSDVQDGSLTNVDVKNFSLGNGDFLTGSVDGRVTTDNSLTGDDINESTLRMPPTTTATFAGSDFADLQDTFRKVAGKTLPAGSWAVVATANTAHYGGFLKDQVSDTVCELRNGTAWIGGATDRRVTPAYDSTDATLSMNGGAQVPAGGGEVSLDCRGCSHTKAGYPSKVQAICRRLILV